MKHKGHIYLVDRDCQVSIVTLIFADTGKMYSDIVGGAYSENELLEGLDDLVAQGEEERDREAKKNIVSD